MLFEREYQTIAAPLEFVYTDKGSRFLAFAYPVNNEAEIKLKLSTLKQLYPDATHHCYAWILHPDKSAQRVNDDGEPANTAGRPILKQLNAKKLTNVILVVIRYFGGKKLGIPGLIEAYGTVAEMCLQNAQILTKTLRDYYLVISPPELEHEVYNLSRRFNAEIIQSNNNAGPGMILAINGSKTEVFLKECEKFFKFEIKFLKTE
jgi:uncharacterized YigZ family protein